LPLGRSCDRPRAPPDGLRPGPRRLDTDHISVGDTILYRNPFPTLRFNDEDIAHQQHACQDGGLVPQGWRAPYPLAEACQDHLVSIAIDQSASSGRRSPRRSRRGGREGLTQIRESVAIRSVGRHGPPRRPISPPRHADPRHQFGNALAGIRLPRRRDLQGRHTAPRASTTGTATALTPGWCSPKDVANPRLRTLAISSSNRSMRTIV